VTLKSGTSLLHYRLIDKIGEGGMGVVWKALDTTLDREVAIKVLPEVFVADTERLTRFEREAKLLASLNHPNIASIYGLHEKPAADSEAPIRFLALELIAGEDLSQRLERGPLSTTEAMNVALQIATALEAAHENGIIHRDIKPANVRFTAPAGGSSSTGFSSTAQSVKVLDFGLAKALDDGEANQNLTQSPTLTGLATQAGVILGTAFYMSPEQARGHAADRRADIFSFGVVLYEMLTGKRPFGGATVSDTLADILRADPDLGALPDDTPGQVRRLLHRCLTKDPAQRLQAIGDARIELREAIDAPESAVAPAAQVEQSHPSRRSPIRFVFGAVLSLALVATGWSLRQPEAPPVEVLRATVTLPAGTLLDSDNRSISLSPDGSMLAYAARDNQGNSGIWMRRMDSTASQLLSGTEDASYPFWSPDGRQLGFFAGGKLRKIPATGGTAVTICDAADGRGASWGAADVIVFSPDPFGPLFKVAAGGGTPIAATSEERTDFTHRNPHFLPDGKRLFFYMGSSSSNHEDDGIYSLNLESGETSRLVAERSEGLYVEPGYLAFVRERSVVVQPIDLETLELSGEPVPVAEQVQFNSFRFTGTFTFARNGLLLHRGGAIQVESRMTWFDLDGKELGQVGEPASYWLNFDIAPNGRQAISGIRHTDGRSDLWMYDLERGLGSRFTFGDDPALLPRWSPDGSHVAYSNGAGVVKVKATDGLTPARMVHDIGANGFVSDWSVDGRQLLLWDQSGANGGELSLVSV